MIKRASSGRTVFETIIILVFVGILLGIAVNKFLQNALSAKESLLQSELTNIRTSVKLYKLINGKYPENLQELTEKEYMRAYSENTVIKGRYLISHAMDEDGAPLDPFGGNYYYNNNTGEVKSLTKGYNDW
jgi:competence protein ComGC